ncbi:DUF2330 domain-containing protein [Streptomyces sp. NPDC054796]
MIKAGIRGSRAVGAVVGRRRALWVVVLVVAAQLGFVAWPAYACGCGGMVPSAQSRIAVDREVSAVRWDGRTEQIVMSLTVSGDAPEAAWIMPVPSRADVKLGDRKLFDELEALAEPVPRERTYFWPRDGDWPFDSSDMAGAPPPSATAPPVDVVGRERLGPFDVARLTATDPDALSGWLKKNGFALPERLSTELEPYVEREWEYVAVRLAPEEGEALGGTLDPLHLTFASDTLVYPMRLSRAATQPQSLGLYVLAPHRMEPRSAIGGERPEVTYAKRLTAGEQPGAVRKLAGGETYVTAVEQFFPRPQRISADHVLARAASDDEFQRVRYKGTLLRWGGMPAWLVTVGGALVVPAAGTTLLVRRERARS